MPQTRIQGKFYPLKSEEWLDSINQLTHSELKILYYVRSLDPYNNGINLSPAQIARDLSTEKNKMHRSTVGRALKFLDRQGFIKMELLQVRIKVNPKGFLAEEETTESKNVVTTQQCCDHATQSAATQHRVQPHNTECAHATQSAATQQLKSENLSEQEIQNSKIIKTYSDFKDSLSEGERENFLDFVKEKTKNLSQPINDIEAWLASKNQAQQNRWEVYYNNFLASLKSFGLDPQKPPIDNKCQQAVKRYEEELERRKKAAQSAWEKRQLEQQTNLNQLEVKVNKLLSIDSKSQTMEVKND